MDKIILVVMDGAGDRGTDTPLHKAYKPNIDFITRLGSSGLVDIIAPGIRPGSDVAHLALLGYNPYEVYTGRGPFEAAGIGIELKPGDIAFRCNFATVDENLIVVDRRAGRISEGTEELAKVIDGMRIDDVRIIFKASVEHRAVLVLRGKGISHLVTDTDPHSTNLRIANARALSKKDSDATRTANVLNKFTKESLKVLSTHELNIKRKKAGKMPANIIITRGAGIVKTLSPISERYGIKGVCIAGVALVKGVCKLAGFDIL